MSKNLPDTPDSDDSTDIETDDEEIDSDLIATGDHSGKTDVKDLDLADESSPLAQETGSTGAQKRQVDDEWLTDILADQIYDSDAVFFREYIQNAETACIRAAKLLIRNHPDYGQEALQHEFWVDEEGEKIASVDDVDRQALLAEYDIADQAVRKETLPVKHVKIVEMARSIGYDPTIEIEVNHEERQIIVEDNGIGMTAHEFDKAFNYTGKSGAKLQSDTGGKWGAGGLTFGQHTGKDGGMEMISVTRRPDAPEVDYDGIRAYVYLGGYNELDNSTIPDDFKGTRFKIPVKPVEDGGSDMNRFGDQVEKYTQMTSVPVLYREYKNGELHVEEEYGGNSLVEKFSNEDGEAPPVVVDRPGEFTAVAGPDVKVGRVSYNDRRPDTWLVSMEIDRNTSASVSSFWDVGIQIHNEQQLCVAGPHRGKLRKNIDDESENDIFTPEPTVDRDRLQSGDDNDAFFEYVAEQIEQNELAQLREIIDEMMDASHPADAVKGNHYDWVLFKQMVNHHGTTNKKSSFLEFVDVNDVFPDIGYKPYHTAGPKSEGQEVFEKVYELFEEFSHAPSGTHNPSKKSSRKEDKLGDILTDTDPENIYMAASTSGNFEDRRRVVKNTHDDWDVIIVSSSQYSKYQRLFGFTKLKNVPLKESDDHEFDVPDAINTRYSKTGSTSSGSKPDNIAERTLKIRNGKDDNASIDRERTIARVIEHLEDGDLYKSVGHHKLVLFPNGKDYENISDHYGLQNYAAIANVTQAEYAELAGYEDVMNYSEFEEWSGSTAIATDHGGRRADELVQDDEYVIMARATNNERKLLLSDEKEGLRERYKRAMFERYAQQDEFDDIVFAVTDEKTFRRARWAMNDFYSSRFTGVTKLVGMALGSSYNDVWNWDPSWRRLPGNPSTYKLKAEMENWQDHSNAIEWLKNAKWWQEEFLRGCHDAGIDPMLLSEGEIRRVVAERFNSDEMHYYGNQPDQTGDGAAASSDQSGN